MQEGTFEALLAAEGVPDAAVAHMLHTLTAWRVTSSGRPLIDRHRRKRVTDNLPLVISHLHEKV